MHLLASDIEQFVADHTSKESEILQELNRETHIKILMPQMLSGQVQGRFLAMLSKMIRPKTILEIGTFTGYSAICLAEGLQAGGLLHTIDINDELEEMATRYFEKAGLSDCIKMHIGAALDIIPNLNEAIDLVFIDADKENYSNYFDAVIDRLSPGGFILADNVLWSGKVVEEEQDKDTEALVAYSKKVQNDPRVENILAPVRDGLLIARKLP